MKPGWWYVSEDYGNTEETHVSNSFYELERQVEHWQRRIHLTNDGDVFDADLYKRCKEIKDIL